MLMKHVLERLEHTDTCAGGEAVAGGGACQQLAAGREGRGGEVVAREF